MLHGLHVGLFVCVGRFLQFESFFICYTYLHQCDAGLRQSHFLNRTKTKVQPPAKPCGCGFRGLADSCFEVCDFFIFIFHKILPT